MEGRGARRQAREIADRLPFPSRWAIDCLTSVEHLNVLRFHTAISARINPSFLEHPASNQAHIRHRRSRDDYDTRAIRALTGRAVPYCSVAHRRRGRAA